MKLPFLATIIIFTAAGCGGIAAEQPSSLADSGAEPKEICSLDGLPDGWVVVGHGRTPACGALSGTSDDFWNSWDVEQASADVITVCSDAQIPAGYVKLVRVRSGACVIPSGTSFDYTNAYVIKKL